MFITKQLIWYLVDIQLTFSCEMIAYAHFYMEVLIRISLPVTKLNCCFLIVSKNNHKENPKN